MRAGQRYRDLFGRLDPAGEAAFIPFLMLGDPAPPASLEAARTLIAAGADALELGLPFSDPVADGPVVQAAAARARAAGVRQPECWNIVSQLRADHPTLPIGLLVYANLVCHQDPRVFYQRAALAGVDSVLVADLPTDEAPLILEPARQAGIAPVFIAPPNADPARLRRIAALSEGYTYVTSREGVTGADDELRNAAADVLARLRELGAAPPVLGFGIAHPEQVRRALELGAAGVISGSAVVEHLAKGSGLAEFVSAMKAATRR